MVKKFILLRYEQGQELNEKDYQLIDEFCDNMRQVDINEIYAASGNNPKQEIIASLQLSEYTYMARDKHTGRVICMFGIGERKNGINGRIIWCLGTNLLDNYKREFLANSAKVLETWAEKYGQLYNFVDVRNDKTIRWLEWLGAKFGEPFKFGINGEEFIYFCLKGGD